MCSCAPSGQRWWHTNVKYLRRIANAVYPKGHGQCCRYRPQGACHSCIPRRLRHLRIAAGRRSNHVRAGQRDRRLSRLAAGRQPEPDRQRGRSARRRSRQAREPPGSSPRCPAHGARPGASAGPAPAGGSKAEVVARAQTAWPARPRLHLAAAASGGQANGATSCGSCVPRYPVRAQASTLTGTVSQVVAGTGAKAGSGVSAVSNAAANAVAPVSPQAAKTIKRIGHGTSQTVTGAANSVAGSVSGLGTRSAGSRTPKGPAEKAQADRPQLGVVLNRAVMAARHGDQATLGS